MFRRIATVAIMLSMFALLMPSPADAAWGRRYKSKSRSSTGYAIRGAGPLRIRVSSGRYRYLKTFYPNQIRRVN